MRKYYVIFPTDYYDELIESGQRNKAGALMEYYRDMKRRRVYPYAEYGEYWFGSRKRKGDAYRWIQDFKREISLFFEHWRLINEQHFLDVKNGVKPKRNRGETFDDALSPELGDFENVTETLVKPNRNMFNESNKNKYSQHPKAPDYTPDPIDLEISEFLYSKLLAIFPQLKKPDIEKWTIHVKRMREIDGRDSEKIKNMITYIFEDNKVWDGSFWRANIKSTEKLRKQYDTIALQIINSMKKAG